MNISKKAFVSTILATGLLCGAVGVYSSNGVAVVQAYLNSTIKFTVNGASWTPKDANGKKLSPLVYNGSTYLPAKAVGEVLNAEVQYNGNSKTVAITTTGSANAGEPYNDAPTPATTKTPTTTTTPQQSSLPSEVLTLPANFDLGTSGEKYKPVGLAFIQAYGSALLSGSSSELNALVDKYMIDDIGNNNMGYKQSAKDYLAKAIAADIKNNDSATMEKYAALLKVTPLSDVEISSSFQNKSENSATLAYKVMVPGFIYSFNILLEFDIDNKTNTYLLTDISVL
ncbi:hypothetical protein PAECIP111893_01133 [Paenibacillus plantiphilus]|uniref:Copper amine oxidase-like N-terminal domain-containing protein n=1 Tax=Paenibacillus plantiphilus TaxID=2905650 RepID=A0ABM9BZI2_9BACL|nr:stalk domain-containing protein [Paenibacillus plantiphilus]CAH1198850.1 hypothetical protein PAECIP111893_01133 [Paenibacillus plantiphilus]